MAFSVNKNATQQRIQIEGFVNEFLDSLKGFFPLVVIDGQTSNPDIPVCTPRAYDEGIYAKGSCFLINARLFYKMLLCVRAKEHRLARRWFFKLAMAMAHEVGGHTLVNRLGKLQVRTPTKLSPCYPHRSSLGAESGNYLGEYLLGGRHFTLGAHP